jgi:hypothetical protein
LIQIKLEYTKGYSGTLGTSIEHPVASTMPEVADYSALEQLRDRRPIKIRALRPEDRTDMLAAIGRTSMQSPQRRFFVPKKVA